MAGNYHLPDAWLEGSGPVAHALLGSHRGPRTLPETHNGSSPSSSGRAWPLAHALERYWISTIDHGFNASTFTARVIASTRADLGAAFVGALGALSGPLHGGAPGRVWEMLDEIGTMERAEGWLRAKLERGERIMGFGHAVYRTEDPRSRLLREVAEGLGGPRVELARHVEERSLALLRELRPGRDLYTNVEFYASIVLEAVGCLRICSHPRSP
jgi:citrate synthase